MARSDPHLEKLKSLQEITNFLGTISSLLYPSYYQNTPLAGLRRSRCGSQCPTKTVLSGVSFPWRPSLCKKIWDTDWFLQEILMTKNSWNLKREIECIKWKKKTFVLLRINQSFILNIFKLAIPLAQPKVLVRGVDKLGYY